MHDDARHLCELSGDLGSGLIQASVTLVAFIGVLWVLSRGFVLTIAGHDFPVPGYMVWAAILYAAFGSLLSYWVGGSLIGRNAERYAREGDLRFALVRVNEHLDGITLAAGEEGERRRLEASLDAVLKATQRLVTGLTNLTWITAGFGWVMIVAPILVAAPLYFGGTLSFGGLMQAAAAFTTAQASLRWFVDNFSTIADWRATLLRVAMFRRAVVAAEVMHPTASRIQVREGEPQDGKAAASALIIDHLEIASPSGCTRLQGGRVEVKPGERVLMLGESGAGKTLLFRALAGLWPWGSGRIVLPHGQHLYCIPRTPYVPPGTLKEALAYPSAVDQFKAHEYSTTLQRLGLSRLVPLLEESRRWDHELNEDEQQAIAFARLLLHAPDWILVDEALDFIATDTRERIRDVLAHELAHCAVIYIGRADPKGGFFSSVLHLVNDPTSRRLTRHRAEKPRAAPYPPPAAAT
jgi:putative ATP-binding cassette transporter